MSVRQSWALTADAEQHGEVGVLSLRALGEDTAEGAQVAQTRLHLSVQTLRQTCTRRLRGAPAQTRSETGLIRLLQALLQGQVLIQQVLVLRGQLEHSGRTAVREDWGNQ